MDNFFLNKNLKENPFKVPENYFDELNHRIASLKNIAEAEEGSEWKVPEQYFDQLESQVIAQVRLLENQKADVFRVSDDYFASLESRIKAQTTKQNFEKSKTPIRSLSFIRYAAAAVLFVLASLSFYFRNKDQASINAELAAIPDQEIVDYLEYSSDPNDMTLIVENANMDDFDLNISRSITN